MNADELRRVLDAIDRNQKAFERARGARRRWRVTVENEALFARIGVRFPPMEIPRGIFGWWLRRFHRCSSCGRRHAVEYLTSSGIVCGDCAGRTA